LHDAAGDFVVTYTVVDALGNERVVTATITVLQIEFDETLAVDLLGT
jgi:hypothetical protein